LACYNKEGEEFEMAVQQQFESNDLEDLSLFSNEWIDDGKRAVIVGQLQRKFGQLSEARMQMIDKVHFENLDALAMSLLDFTSVADLDAWLSEQANQAVQ
jgi:hypothetical protein